MEIGGGKPFGPKEMAALEAELKRHGISAGDVAITPWPTGARVISLANASGPIKKAAKEAAATMKHGSKRYRAETLYIQQKPEPWAPSYSRRLAGRQRVARGDC